MGLVGSTGAQEDYYKLTLSKNGALKIRFMHDNPYAQNEEYYTVYLYDNSYNEINSFTIKGGQTSVDSANIGLAAGNYYVRVHGNPLTYSENCEYSFRTIYTESEYWEKQNNENVTTTTSISLNKTYNGSTKSAGDVDFYKVKLSKRGYVRLTFGHDTYEQSETYYVVYLYDSNQNVITSFNVKGSSSTTSSAQIGLAAGTYYVRVLGNSLAYSEKTEYRFKLAYTESEYWEKENNENVTTSTSISFNKT